MNSDLKGFYKHYKGNMYRVLDIIHHSETLEELVLYEALYENPIGKLWVRPKEMFFGKIIHEGIVKDRFEFISNGDPNEYSK